MRLVPLARYLQAEPQPGGGRLSRPEGRTARWASDLTAGGEAAAFQDAVPRLHGFIWFPLPSRPPPQVA